MRSLIRIIPLLALLALTHPTRSQTPQAPPTTSEARASPFAAPADQTIRSIPLKASPAITLRGQSNVVIKGLRIAEDVSIDLDGCEDVVIISCDLRSIKAGNVKRLRIYNSYLHDSPHNAIDLYECSDVVVQGNRIERVSSGVYAHRSTAVQVVGNYCEDVQGPMPRGQLVQFNQVTGPDNLILGNHAVNHHGQSRPEDVINLYKSTGTAESPIRVELNHLAGDPARGSQDKSTSGSGIMLGDGGGRYQVAMDNTLVSPGQVGIGVAGGGDILVQRNTILGTRSNIANVGLYAWNQYPDTPAHPVTLTRNRIDWINSQGISNPYWNGGGFPRVTSDGNTFGDASLRADPPRPPAPAPRPPILHGQDVELPYELP